MTVHFVFRSPENVPTWRIHHRWKDATVVKWFRRNWRGIEDEEEAREHAENLLGANVYSFFDVFLAIERDALPKPSDIEGVMSALNSVYRNEIRYEEHCLQVLTDDDDQDMAYYFFDDEFLAQHGELAVYLLHDDWRLPDGTGLGGWQAEQQTIPWSDVPAAGGAGRIFSSFILHESSSDLADLEPDFAEHLDGVRVPNLARFLLGLTEKQVEMQALYCRQLHQALHSADLVESAEERAFVRTLQEDPTDEATWRAYTDWLMEHGEQPPGQRLLERGLTQVKEKANYPSQYLIQVGEHVMQLFAHSDQWVLFDDVWGSAHPELATAILRYATRWDVLSTGKEKVKR